MASDKRTTKVLRNPRDRTVAYARKQKPPGDGSSDSAGSSEDSAEGASSDTQDTIEGSAPSSVSAAPVAPAAPVESATPAAIDAPAPEPAAPAAAPPAIDPVLRARTETIKMPVQASIGVPPAMPTLPKDAAPTAGADTQRAEDPTSMPGPREIPTGRPDDAARPPGLVPSGDSRSMRRRTNVHEFALIYRMQTFVISRFGVVGTRGQWRVVEYPTSSAASHAYAKECSRFVSDGFSDYREWGGI